MVAQTSPRPPRRPATQRPLRAAVYHRVSSEEQVEGFSLDAQRRATAAHCEAQGWEVVAEYRDEGKSARSDDLAKRPAFAEMLDGAEAGLFDVVVVHKLDRFARNLLVTLETLQRLERWGVGFVSITEQMDFTTPMGKVLLALLASFAQFYSDNLSQETKKGKRERKAQGLYNGLLPFGVKKNSQGIPVPDPETYPGLLLAFRLAADGKSDKEVADALNTAGYRTTGNRGRNPFTKDTVRPMLLNRFYLGELPDGEGGWVPGVHEPLLDDGLFAEAERMRGLHRRQRDGVGHARRTYALSGLAVCGRCGGKLHCHTRPNGRAELYCYQARQASTACTQRSALLDRVEEQVAGYLGTFRLPEEVAERIAELFERAGDERDDTERRRRDLTGRLERLAELYQLGDLTRDAYRAQRERLQTELASLAGASDRAEVIRRAAALLRDLPAAWAATTPEQRNGLAKLVFEAVVVRDDRLHAVQPRPDFAPFFLLAPQDNEKGRSDRTGPSAGGCQTVGLTYGSDGHLLLGFNTLPLAA